MSFEHFEGTSNLTTVYNLRGVLHDASRKKVVMIYLFIGLQPKCLTERRLAKN